MKRIFISTGEVSGDLQGSLLVQALYQNARAQGIKIEIVALGGVKMAAAGAQLLGDTTGIGSMGIVEHFAFLGPTFKLQSQARQYLQANPPDAIILIDYMGPNMFIGKFAKQTFPDIPVFYYIAPQQWVYAASENDTKNIVNFTHRLFAVFPYEASFYAAKGANAQFVGHPLVDRMASCPSRAAARAALGIAEEETAIALIPASRWQELKYLMPVIFEAAQRLQTMLPNVRFWVPLSREAYRESIQAAIDQYQLQATLVAEQPDAVLAAADLAITKCGTVSLELGLLTVPHLVIYRVSKITAWIARHILRVNFPFISPVNLAEMKPIVLELLQEEANADRIVEESLALLQNVDRRNKMLADYAEMREAFGPPGVCDRVAEEILTTVGSSRVASTR
jgi:lipid-A-disaccharide synthase